MGLKRRLNSDLDANKVQERPSDGLPMQNSHSGRWGDAASPSPFAARTPTLLPPAASNLRQSPKPNSSSDSPPASASLEPGESASGNISAAPPASPQIGHPSALALDPTAPSLGSAPAASSSVRGVVGSRPRPVSIAPRPSSVLVQGLAASPIPDAPSAGGFHIPTSQHQAFTSSHYTSASGTHYLPPGSSASDISSRADTRSAATPSPSVAVSAAVPPSISGPGSVFSSFSSASDASLTPAIAQVSDDPRPSRPNPIAPRPAKRPLRPKESEQSPSTQRPFQPGSRLLSHPPTYSHPPSQPSSAASHPALPTEAAGAVPIALPRSAPPVNPFPYIPVASSFSTALPAGHTHPRPLPPNLQLRGPPPSLSLAARSPSSTSPSTPYPSTASTWAGRDRGAPMSSTGIPPPPSLAPATPLSTSPNNALSFSAPPVAIPTPISASLGSSSQPFSSSLSTSTTPVSSTSTAGPLLTPLSAQSLPALSKIDSADSSSFHGRRRLHIHHQETETDMDDYESGSLHSDIDPELSSGMTDIPAKCASNGINTGATNGQLSNLNPKPGTVTNSSDYSSSTTDSITAPHSTSPAARRRTRASNGSRTGRAAKLQTPRGDGRPRRTEYAPHMRAYIIGLYEGGKSSSEIAREQSMPRSTVRYIIDHKEEVKARMGKSATRHIPVPKISPQEEEKILDLVRKVPNITYGEIISRLGLEVSKPTLRNCLKRNKVKLAVPVGGGGGGGANASASGRTGGGSATGFAAGRVVPAGVSPGAGAGAEGERTSPYWTDSHGKEDEGTKNRSGNDIGVTNERESGDLQSEHRDRDESGSAPMPSSVTPSTIVHRTEGDDKEEGREGSVRAPFGKESERRAEQEGESRGIGLATGSLRTLTATAAAAAAAATGAAPVAAPVVPLAAPVLRQ